MLQINWVIIVTIALNYRDIAGLKILLIIWSIYIIIDNHKKYSRCIEI